MPVPPPGCACTKHPRRAALRPEAALLRVGVDYGVCAALTPSFRATAGTLRAMDLPRLTTPSPRDLTL